VRNPTIRSTEPRNWCLVCVYFDTGNNIHSILKRGRKCENYVTLNYVNLDISDIVVLFFLTILFLFPLDLFSFAILFCLLLCACSWIGNTVYEKLGQRCEASKKLVLMLGQKMRKTAFPEMNLVKILEVIRCTKKSGPNNETLKALFR